MSIPQTKNAAESHAPVCPMNAPIRWRNVGLIDPSPCGTGFLVFQSLDWYCCSVASAYSAEFLRIRWNYVVRFARG